MTSCPQVHLARDFRPLPSFSASCPPAWKCAPLPTVTRMDSPPSPSVPPTAELRTNSCLHLLPLLPLLHPPLSPLAGVHPPPLCAWDTSFPQRWGLCAARDLLSLPPLKPELWPPEPIPASHAHPALCSGIFCLLSPSLARPPPLPPRSQLSYHRPGVQHLMPPHLGRPVLGERQGTGRRALAPSSASP